MLKVMCPTSGETKEKLVYNSVKLTKVLYFLLVKMCDRLHVHVPYKLSMVLICEVYNCVLCIVSVM